MHNWKLTNQWPSSCRLIFIPLLTQLQKNLPFSRQE